MKLRNKKTGEVIDGCFVVCEYEDGERFSVKDKPVFDSLAELTEDWEDYKPEPWLLPEHKEALRNFVDETKLKPTDKIKVVQSGLGTKIVGKKWYLFMHPDVGNLEDGTYLVADLLEDYEEKEPRIKDGINRKLVRVWAEALGISRCRFEYFVRHHDEHKCFSHGEYTLPLRGDSEIDCEPYETYTITELCGEKEDA